MNPLDLAAIGRPASATGGGRPQVATQTNKDGASTSGSQDFARLVEGEPTEVRSRGPKGSGLVPKPDEADPAQEIPQIADLSAMEIELTAENGADEIEPDPFFFIESPEADVPAELATLMLSEFDVSEDVSVEVLAEREMTYDLGTALPTVSPEDPDAVLTEADSLQVAREGVPGSIGALPGAANAEKPTGESVWIPRVIDAPRPGTIRRQVSAEHAQVPGSTEPKATDMAAAKVEVSNVPSQTKTRTPNLHPVATEVIAAQPKAQMALPTEALPDGEIAIQLDGRFAAGGSTTETGIPAAQPRERNIAPLQPKTAAPFGDQFPITLPVEGRARTDEPNGALPEFTSQTAAEVTAPAAREMSAPVASGFSASVQPLTADANPELMMEHGALEPLEEHFAEHVTDASRNRGSLPAQTHTQRINEQIAAAIGKMNLSLAGDEKRLEIRLDPPELGRLSLHFHNGETGVTVQVSAERPDTGDLLRRNAELLRDILREQGFGDAMLQFGSGGSRGERGQSGEAQTEANGANREVWESGSRAPSLARNAMANASGIDIRL